MDCASGRADDRGAAASARQWLVVRCLLLLTLSLAHVLLSLAVSADAAAFGLASSAVLDFAIVWRVAIARLLDRRLVYLRVGLLAALLRGILQHLLALRGGVVDQVVIGGARGAILQYRSEILDSGAAVSPEAEDFVYASVSSRRRDVLPLLRVLHIIEVHEDVMIERLSHPVVNLSLLHNLWLEVRGLVHLGRQDVLVLEGK